MKESVPGDIVPGNNKLSAVPRVTDLGKVSTTAEIKDKNCHNGQNQDLRWDSVPLDCY